MLRRAGSVLHLGSRVEVALVTAQIYPIDDLLESLKGPVLQIQNYRNSMKQNSDRMSKKSPSEDPELRSQRPCRDMAKNICKQMSVGRGVYQGTHYDCSLHRFLFSVWEGRVCKGRR